jgi:hypothetical protein
MICVLSVVFETVQQQQGDFDDDTSDAREGRNDKEEEGRRCARGDFKGKGKE